MGLCGFSAQEAIYIKKAVKQIEANNIWYSQKSLSEEEILGQHFPFCDIFMLNAQGVKTPWEQLVLHIRKFGPQAYLILVSDTEKTAVQGYKYDIKNCLMKPLNPLHMAEEIKRFLNCRTFPDMQYIWLQRKKGILKIYTRLLRFIESDGHLLLLHYDKHVIEYNRRETLNGFMKMLPENQFFRCNNSYKEEIPLSRNRKKELVESRSMPPFVSE